MYTPISCSREVQGITHIHSINISAKLSISYLKSEEIIIHILEFITLVIKNYTLFLICIQEECNNVKKDNKIEKRIIQKLEDKKS